MQGVSLQRNGTGLTRFARGKPACCAAQHLACKVRSQYGPRPWWATLQHCHRHVPCPAANIEHRGIGVGQNCAKAPCRLPPPKPVHTGGQHMVEQVIARSNCVEHLLHGFRRARLVLHTHRFGASYGHFARRSLACECSLARESIYVTAASNSAGAMSSTTPAPPIPTGSTNLLTPPTFFLSPPVAANTLAARNVSGGSGP